MRLRDAALWVLGAGIAAQLAGGIVADLLRSLLRARGATEAQVDHAPMVVIPSLVASSLALLSVTLFAPHVAGVPLRAALGLRRAPAAAFALVGLGTVALGPIGDALMQAFAELFPDATLGVVPMLNELVAITPLFAVWPAFALLPGLSEELAFRGLLQQAVRSRAAAIAISGVAFALFHVDPHHVVGVLPLGLFLAWAGARFGTYVTVCAHVLNNTTAILMVRLGEAGAADEQSLPAEWLIGSAVVVGLCALLLSQLRSDETARHVEH